MRTLADRATGLKRRAFVRCGFAERKRLAALPACILVYESTRLGDPAAILARLPRGAAVILRDYDACDRSTCAAHLAVVCRQRKLRLLVGVATDADARLAFAVGAAGLHFTERRLAHGPGQWRLWRKRGWMVSAAAHTPAAIARARRAGVDAVLLSPAFPTATHPGAKIIGPVRFAAWTRAAGIPVYALGGMTAATARRLAASGAIGIAAIGGFAAL